MSSIEIVYFCRHASPIWYHKDFPYLQLPGPPLTERGEAEAVEMGYFLRRAGIIKLLSSPYRRCLQTAEAISTMIGVPVEVNDGIRESQPEEPPEAVVERFMPVFNDVNALCRSRGTAAIVSHGSPIDVMLQALGAPPEVLERERRYDHDLPIPTGGIWKVWRSQPNLAWNFALVFSPNHRAKDEAI